MGFSFVVSLPSCTLCSVLVMISLKTLKEADSESSYNIQP